MRNRLEYVEGVDCVFIYEYNDDNVKNRIGKLDQMLSVASKLNDYENVTMAKKQALVTLNVNFDKLKEASERTIKELNEQVSDMQEEHQEALTYKDSSYVALEERALELNGECIKLKESMRQLAELNTKLVEQHEATATEREQRMREWRAGVWSDVFTAVTKSQVACTVEEATGMADGCLAEYDLRFGDM